MTNSILNINPNGSITLCGRKNSCCPVMTPVDKDVISITDDDGNKITIKKEQARLINQALDVLEENNKPNEQLLFD